MFFLKVFHHDERSFFEGAVGAVDGSDCICIDDAVGSTCVLVVAMLRG